jgi:predicted PilT family ATPase
LSNFTLWYDGEEVATVDSTNDKYLTFNLDDAVLIEDGKTEKFVVTANIDGGAAKTIQFYIDKELDVMATASKYGYVFITNNVDTANSVAVDVEAGELSIVTTEPTMTEIRKDKDNLVI